MSALDPRTGIVTRLDHGTSHAVLHTATADLAATDGHALPLGNQVVGGTSWTSPERAAQRALGEAVERYAGHLIDPRRLRRATAAALGPSAVPLDAFALYRPDQLTRPGFPFTGFDPIAERLWIQSTHPTPLWLPASLTWLPPGPHTQEFPSSRAGSRTPEGPSPHTQEFPSSRAGSRTPEGPGPHAGEFSSSRAGSSRPGGPGSRARGSADASGGVVHLPVGAGIAAGPTFAQARESALAEVVERHALATAWYRGDRFPELPRQAVPEPVGAELTWYAVPNLLGAPVVACAARSAAGIALGCALTPGAADPVATSARKAAAEALLSLDAIAAVADGVPEWSAVLHPVRADRRYADSYRPDLSDATDLVCTLQLLADPRMTDAIATRLAKGDDRNTRHPDPAPHWPPPGDRGGWRPDPVDLDSASRAVGLTPLTVDLSPADLPGWCCARVLVPGLRSVGPAAFPFLGDGVEPLPPGPPSLPLPHV
ncbi:YcaO-like family protein [Actinocorallia sp. A-T 12471]|uniref:YcaO-like family protein n=1 Tax=Actinocorallia sp. A-T 12471 TaxID=3089813 RepID=UPI0029CAFEFA|nr:YcaO-like family protein [Actinocorallia sp. A-T 12471]MDX6742422.1 YcaO-like family protein [Actinocorallia sp. A-T 12471]